MKLIKVIFLLFFLLLYSNYASADCKPDFNLPSETIISKNSEKKNPVFVFFDGSLSMQGFVKDQAGQKNLYRDVIDDLQQISENVGNKTYYHRFGSKVEPIKENEIAGVTKSSFYVCKDSQAKCNNQETRIELPFKAAKANKDGTYVIVTDLFLSNNQLVGSTLASLTKPLKSILKDGNSIGIFGVMSSFNGNIFDIPTKQGGTIKYSDAKKRPFYIIVIGNQKNINQIKKNLEEQHFLDEEDINKFALITSSPISQSLNSNELITENFISRINTSENFKFEYDDKLPVFKFDTDKKRKLKFKIKNEMFIVPGSTGISSYTIKENLWSSKETNCRKISEWRKANFEKISSVNEKAEKELEINLFKEVPLNKLFRGMRYFYTASIYAEKPGNLSEEIFSDWSIRDSEAEDFTSQSPVEYKTLNLSKIVKILNSVANDAYEPTLIANIALNFNLLK